MINNKNIPRLRFSEFDEEWKCGRIEDKMDVTMGQSPHSENYTYDTNQNILVQGNADILNGEIHPRIYTSEITKISKKNEIIMTVRAPVGELALNQFKKVVIGRGVASLSGNIFDYFLLDRIKRMGIWNRLSSGSTFEAVNSSDIKSINIKFPKIDEQQKIGSFFLNIDKLISLQTRKLKQLKKLKQGYLQKMFPQSLKLMPILRFNEFNDEWNYVRLGNVVKISMGQSPHSINYTNDSTQSGLVQGNADIKNGEIYPRVYTKEITKIAYKDEIIMTVRAPVGKLAINQLDSVVIGRGVASLNANKYYFYLLENINRLGVWKKLSS